MPTLATLLLSGKALKGHQEKQVVEVGDNGGGLRWLVSLVGVGVACMESHVNPSLCSAPCM